MTTGTLTATRSSNAASKKVWVPPPEQPVTPMRLSSISGRDSKKSTRMLLQSVGQGLEDACGSSQVSRIPEPDHIVGKDNRPHPGQGGAAVLLIRTQPSSGRPGHVHADKEHGLFPFRPTGR